MADEVKSGLSASQYLPGVLSAVGSFGSGLMNLSAQRENVTKQMQMFREQMRFQKEMYQMQKADQEAWNDEAAKRQRMLKAGLNPALNFSDAQGMSMPSGMSAPAAPAIQAPQNNFSDVATNAAAVISSLVGAEKQGQEAKGVSIDNMWQLATWMKRLEDLEKEIKKKGSEADKNSAEANKADAEATAIDWKRRLLVSTFGQQAKSFELDNLQKVAMTEMYKAQMRDYDSKAALNDSIKALNVTEQSYKAQQLQKGIELLMSQIGANSSLAKKYDEETNVAKELARLTNLQGNEIDAIMPYVLPRIKSEIYRNTTTQHSGGLKFFGSGFDMSNESSAYNDMFDDWLRKHTENEKNKTKGKERQKSDFEKYGNTD